MSNQELFIVKEDQKVTEDNILDRPISRIASSEKSEAHLDCHDEDKKDQESTFNKKTDSCEILEKPCLGGGLFDEVEKEDGFRTPPSLEHKIPESKECPPAPRKRKPAESNKTKVSSNARRILVLDELIDIESLFNVTPLKKSRWLPR